MGFLYQYFSEVAYDISSLLKISFEAFQVRSIFFLRKLFLSCFTLLVFVFVFLSVLAFLFFRFPCLFVCFSKVRSLGLIVINHSWHGALRCKKFMMCIVGISILLIMHQDAVAPFEHQRPQSVQPG